MYIVAKINVLQILLFTHLFPLQHMPSRTQKQRVQQTFFKLFLRDNTQNHTKTILMNCTTMVNQE